MVTNKFTKTNTSFVNNFDADYAIKVQSELKKRIVNEFLDFVILSLLNKYACLKITNVLTDSKKKIRHQIMSWYIIFKV